MKPFQMSEKQIIILRCLNSTNLVNTENTMKLVLVVLKLNEEFWWKNSLDFVQHARDYTKPKISVKQFNLWATISAKKSVKLPNQEWSTNNINHFVKWIKKKCPRKKSVKNEEKRWKNRSVNKLMIWVCNSQTRKEGYTKWNISCARSLDSLKLSAKNSELVAAK